MFDKVKNLFRRDKKEESKAKQLEQPAAAAAVKKRCVGDFHADTAFKCTSDKCIQ